MHAKDYGYEFSFEDYVLCTQSQLLAKFRLFLSVGEEDRCGSYHGDDKQWREGRSTDLVKLSHY
jgi:hypothetical protein